MQSRRATVLNAKGAPFQLWIRFNNMMDVDLLLIHPWVHPWWVRRARHMGASMGVSIWVHPGWTAFISAHHAIMLWIHDGTQRSTGATVRSLTASRGHVIRAGLRTSDRIHTEPR